MSEVHGSTPDASGCTASPDHAHTSGPRFTAKTGALAWAPSGWSTGTSAPARSTRCASASTARTPWTMTPVNVFGVASLIFWSLTIVVSIKYVGFILKAGQSRRRRHLRTARPDSGRPHPFAAAAVGVVVGVSSARRCCTGTGSSPRRYRCCRPSRVWRSPPRRPSPSSSR